MITAQDLVAAAKSKIQEVTLDQADSALANAAFILDVREPEEYAAGHLANSINIPRGLLEFKLAAMPEIEADSKVVIYCKPSGRSALAALTMKEMSYNNISSIEGGFDAWLAADKAVVTPVTPIDDLSFD